MSSIGKASASENEYVAEQPKVKSINEGKFEASFGVSKKRLLSPALMDRAIDNSSKTPWLVFVVLIAIIFVIYMLYTLANSSSDSYVLSVDADLIDIAEVQKSVFMPIVTSAAQIQPDTVYYIENKDAGRVEAIYLRAGETVKKGDKLIKLTNTDMLMSVLNLETNVAEQVSNLNELKTSYSKIELEYDLEITRLDFELSDVTQRLDRVKPLVKTSFISAENIEKLEREKQYKYDLLELRLQRKELDLADRKAQIETASSTVNDIRRNLEIAKKSLEDLVIKSEIDGVLASLNVELGQFKERGSPLGKVYQMGTPKVNVRLDEYYLPRISVGTKATYYSLNSSAYPLTLTTVLPEISSGQMEVEFEFLEMPQKNFVPGQTIDIDISVGDSTQNAIVIPNGEFMGQTGGRWVFVLDEFSDKAVRREITIGERSSDQIKVISGIKQGEKVIVSSYRDMMDASELNIE
jgi:HlyD family secretion protein